MVVRTIVNANLAAKNFGALVGMTVFFTITPIVLDMWHGQKADFVSAAYAKNGGDDGGGDSDGGGSSGGGNSGSGSSGGGNSGSGSSGGGNSGSGSSGGGNSGSGSSGGGNSGSGSSGSGSSGKDDSRSDASDRDDKGRSKSSGSGSSYSKRKQGKARKNIVKRHVNGWIEGIYSGTYIVRDDKNRTIIHRKAKPSDFTNLNSGSNR